MNEFASLLSAAVRLLKKSLSQLTKEKAMKKDNLKTYLRISVVTVVGIIIAHLIVNLGIVGIGQLLLRTAVTAALLMAAFQARCELHDEVAGNFVGSVDCMSLGSLVLGSLLSASLLTVSAVLAVEVEIVWPLAIGIASGTALFCFWLFGALTIEAFRA